MPGAPCLHLKEKDMGKTSSLAVLAAGGAALALLAGPARADARVYLNIGAPATAYTGTGPVYVEPGHVYTQPGYGYVYTQPGHVYTQPGYIYTQPGYVYSQPRHYHGFRGRDRDRDGVPDRFDRDRDNDGRPNWRDRDRDGDGVPNRWDRRPDNPRRY